jgi:NMD protein affecting ribosome stability and mRNA decay
MLNASYYEAIIQIRPSNKEVLEFIDKKISERKGMFISKVEKLKTGVDLYVSDQRFARALSKFLKKKFGGEVKLTRKLHTVSKRTGKPLYRVTVLFRLKE